MSAHKLAVGMVLSSLAVAQVEKVAITTTGISCGVCAAVSEVQFRRLPTVAHVAISLSRETITLSYKPGSSFDPRQIRQVLRPLEVGVALFQITAAGRVRQEAGKCFFDAGRDSFILVPEKTASAIPIDTAVLIEGIVNDSLEPIQLKISSFRPLKK
jgi:copper chaperone CopZ